MSKLRCAVLGYGIGRLHAEAYARHPETELVAVADADSGQQAAAAQRFPDVRIYSDFRELLHENSPDIVSIALPNYLHAAASIESLERGAHVLCEKPPALNLRDTRLMRDTAEKAGRQLAINLHQRYRHSALKQRVQRGDLGEMYHGRATWTRRDGAPRFGGWFGQKQYSGGGPLIDLGVHRIDLALWLMGNPEPLTISGTLHHRFGRERALQAGVAYDVEDYAAGFIRCAGGVSLQFEVSWIGHQAIPEEQSMNLLGSKGALEFRNPNWWIHARSDHGYYSQTVENPAEEGFIPLIHPFVDSVVGGTPFEPSIDDGLRIQKILDAFYLSAQLEREVALSEIS